MYSNEDTAVAMMGDAAYPEDDIDGLDDDLRDENTVLRTPGSYVVGLPCSVTVAADGSLTITVDLSEAGEAVADEGGTDEDIAKIDALIEKNRWVKLEVTA